MESNFIADHHQAEVLEEHDKRRFSLAALKTSSRLLCQEIGGFVLGISRKKKRKEKKTFKSKSRYYAGYEAAFPVLRLSLFGVYIFPKKKLVNQPRVLPSPFSPFHRAGATKPLLNYVHSHTQKFYMPTDIYPRIL